MSGLPELATLALAACSAQPRHIDGLLRRLRGPHPRRVVEVLDTLSVHGLVAKCGGDHYALTVLGQQQAAGLGRGC